jgi:hypothetical protein
VSDVCFDDKVSSYANEVLGSNQTGVSMRRWLKRIAVGLLLTLVVVALSMSWALRQTQQVPEFYTRATQQMPVDIKAASETLQNDVVQLQDAASQLGSWSATFSEEQINAWLVQQLPKEFPLLLPRGVEQPRIAIEDRRILAAARYKNSRIDTVISFEIKVELTETANVLAVRIENLRAGSLPLPLQSFLRGISHEAAKGDIEVVWDMDDNGPVALVTVPSEHPNYQKSPVIIESVMLENGNVLLAGHTGDEAVHAYKPRTSVYQLASARVGKNSQFQRSLRNSDLSSERMR